MTKVYGYGRVSRISQESLTQKMLIEEALKLPVDEWYEDHAVSGKIKAADRPNFSRLIKDSQRGDTIVFSRVDRIGRQASNILNTVEELLERGVEVYILQIGKVPLSSAAGMMQLTIYSAFAENERLSIAERTRDALAFKKQQGIVLGPKHKIPPETLKALCEERLIGKTLDELSAKYGFDRNTILRNTKKWAGKVDEYEATWFARSAQRSA